MVQNELFRTAAYSNIVLLVSFGTRTTLLHQQYGHKKEESAIMTRLALQGKSGYFHDYLVWPLPHISQYKQKY